MKRHLTTLPALVFWLAVVVPTATACSVARECHIAPVVMNRLDGLIGGPQRILPGATIALYREHRYCQWQSHSYRIPESLRHTKPDREVKADDDGEFSFGRIPPGKYLLTISKDG